MHNGIHDICILYSWSWSEVSLGNLNFEIDWLIMILTSGSEQKRVTLETSPVEKYWIFM